jgi:hypothetical protein
LLQKSAAAYRIGGARLGHHEDRTPTRAWHSVSQLRASEGRGDLPWQNPDRPLILSDEERAPALLSNGGLNLMTTRRETSDISLVFEPVGDAHWSSFAIFGCLATSGFATRNSIIAVSR